MSAEVKIRPVEAAEINMLAQLSAQTFYDAFAHLNNAEDVQHYIAATYNEDNLLQEFNQPGSCFYFAETDKQPVGYLKLNYSGSQTEFQQPDEAEIQRIYVSATHQGRRIGGQLIRFAINEARQNLCHTLWLGVWEHNVHAIRFYERHGFCIFSRHSFLLGNDLQTDLLMRKKL